MAKLESAKMPSDSLTNATGTFSVDLDDVMALNESFINPFNNSLDYTNYKNVNGTGDNYHWLYGAYGNDYTDFVYEAFDFELPIYLYIWETLVIITVLVNILVVWVLLQKQMQSVTNLILVAIAISDSMTGLVTLPTYIMVYMHTTASTENQALPIQNTTIMTQYYEYLSEYDPDAYEEYMSNITITDFHIEERAAYMLSKSLCHAFMISKFFLSKAFHTISIWLTVFLGVQRYISVAYPFKTKFWFTKQNTLVICIVITILAPVLHIYHVVNEKAVGGFCAWQLIQGSVGDAVHLWTTLLLRHFLPCTTLIVTTILFVIHLKRNAFSEQGSNSSRVFTGNVARGDENRRVSKIVIAIVIVFLVSEVPYTVFLMMTTIVRHTNAYHLSSQERNRAFHAGYELAVVLSFQLNFYIYTFLNRRFRQQLKRMCSKCRSRARGSSMTSSSASGMSTDSGRKTVGLTTTTDVQSHTMEGKGSVGPSPDEQDKTPIN